MGVAPSLPGFGYNSIGTATTSGIAVPMGLSNTPGAWTELVASTALVTQWIAVQPYQTSILSNAVAVLLDFAVGAAGAEQVIVPSMYIGQITTTPQLHYLIPVHIPAGSRVSARTTTAHPAGTSSTVLLNLLAGSPDTPHLSSPQKLVALGADVANSQGVLVNVNDTWTTIVASTPQPFRAIVPTFGFFDNDTSTTDHLVSVGMGASGSERTIGEYSTNNTASEFLTSRCLVIPAIEHIPAGTRLAFKTSVASAGNHSVVMLGVPY